VLGFAFAASHASGDPIDICNTVAHEAGHVYGLDHAFDCRDPMTYLSDCGAKHFLNLALPCGEFDGARPCQCRPEGQDSHVVLTEALGPGTIPDAAPISITLPLAGATVPAAAVVFVAQAEPRVLVRVELWVNGRRAADVVPDRDAPMIELRVPSDQPDGVLDLVVRAFTDLGQEATAAVRVTQGLPCTAVDACGADATCDELGRCMPTLGDAELGEACADRQACVSQRCDDELQRCTQACAPAVEGQCPSGFTCWASPDGAVTHACWPDSEIPTAGGCCDAGAGGGLGALALGLPVALRLRRRRRR
jgi:hypothetical protein